jgi:hypothetical protein
VSPAWFERRRDALFAAILPTPGRGLPAFAELDSRAFWARFAEAAPAHLRLGFVAAVLVLGGTLPLLYGQPGPFETLDDDAKDEVLERAQYDRVLGPVLRPLLDVAKVVACFAYFSDASVEATVRGRPS